MKHARWILVVGVLLAALPARAQTIALAADRDATLIESPDGVLANGSGPLFFAGRTNQSPGGVRRALLHFTLSDLPGDARGRGVVENAALVIHVLPGNPGPREIRLFAARGPWTEGASAASGGVGAPAQAGDVTWLHASFPDAFWPTSGGQFDGLPLASATVDAEGTYRFEGPDLVRLVQTWAQHPDQNFGILLAGDETARQTSKSIASRENPDPALQPVLEITVRPRSLDRRWPLSE